MRVLDLGSGYSEIAQTLWPDAERVRVDKDPETHPDILADVRALPDTLGTFQHILASHVLEHIGRYEVLQVLTRWVDLLEEGGMLHILVPDLRWAAEEILLSPITVPVLMHLFGSQENDGQFHLWGYTALSLRSLLNMVPSLHIVELHSGLYGIRRPGKETVEARQLYAKCVKRGGPDGDSGPGDAPERD